MIIAGIDEAGYGPLLGPLVVSSCVFEVPDDQADTSLWELLRESVAPSVRKRDPRLPISDSKKLHKGDDGLAHLERTALSCLLVGGDIPATFRELLNRLAPGTADAAKRYPWYAGLDQALPLRCEPTELAMHANALRRNLAGRGCSLLGAISETLCEGHFNDVVSKTRNKSLVLLNLTLRLILRIGKAHGGRSIRIYVDRQGGRTRYGRWLMTGFDGHELKIVNESNERSAYRLHGPNAEWQVEFIKGGEDRQLPVALASIYSKYIRECFMCLFNAYWRERSPTVRPTAGYYSDGKRFLIDIAPHLRELKIPQAELVRQL